MDLSAGFPITAPPIVVPWLVNSVELERILAGTGFNKITAGYYTLECEPLPGLRCKLGFHLHNTGDSLTELEFFRNSYSDQKASFAEFQQHFESAFGRPTNETPGRCGFPSYVWKLPVAQIVHNVVDRFGPEEHMRIQYQ